MTRDADRAAEPLRDPPGGDAEVVVVASDERRLALLRAALRMAGVPAWLTLDPDEAEHSLTGRRPAALVLDADLPRPAVLQLYGVVRGNDQPAPVPVVFVGREGSTGGGDYFLADETSPLAVAAQVSDLLVACRPAALAPSSSGPEPAANAPGAQPAAPEPARPDGGAAARPESLSPPPERVAAGVESPSAVRRPREPAAAGVADDGGTEAPSEPVAADRGRGVRLDILLVRIGIVLLIAGLLLLYVFPSSFPPALMPPTGSP